MTVLPALLAPLRAPVALLLGGLMLGGAILPTLDRAAVRRGFDVQMQNLVVYDVHGHALASVFTTDHQRDPAYVWMTPSVAPGRLDPVISRAAADRQAPRIARARHLPLAAVRGVIATSSFNPTFSLRGEPSVNVLSVNLRLDQRLA